MLYKIEVGLYEGNRDIQYCTTLSRKDDDEIYYESKRMRYTDYLKLSEYSPLTRKWEHVLSILNF